MLSYVLNFTVILVGKLFDIINVRRSKPAPPQASEDVFVHIFSFFPIPFVSTMALTAEHRDTERRLKTPRESLTALSLYSRESIQQ